MNGDDNLSFFIHSLLIHFLKDATSCRRRYEWKKTGLSSWPGDKRKKLMSSSFDDSDSVCHGWPSGTVKRTLPSRLTAKERKSFIRDNDEERRKRVQHNVFWGKAMLLKRETLRSPLILSWIWKKLKLVTAGSGVVSRHVVHDIFCSWQDKKRVIVLQSHLAWGGVGVGEGQEEMQKRESDRRLNRKKRVEGKERRDTKDSTTKQHLLSLHRPRGSRMPEFSPLIP